MVRSLQIACANVLPGEVFCDTLIIGLLDETLNSVEMARAYGNPLATLLSLMVRDQPECCQLAETTIIHNTADYGSKRIVIIGLGKKDKLTLDKIRELSAIAIRVAKKLKSRTVATAIYRNHHNLSDAAISIIQGAILGSYEFNNYKTDAKSNIIEKIILVGPDLPSDQEWLLTLNNAKVIADSVNFARDLTNHPSCYMNPSQMASIAQDIASQFGFEINVLDKGDMEKHKMYAMLAVAQGSTTPPKMITLKYIGNQQSNDLIAFVGKGITFDSGGISLKPSEKMGDMKGDMAGGAAVLAAMQAIGHLKPKVNILAIIPCTENMPSGHAFKPGDVICSMSGKTIEIISTDAEGRLLLADAVTYARKLGATRIIDLATLTGACVVALGNITSGLISNNDGWSKEILRASKQTGEKMWLLPSYDDYLNQIKSDIADLKNSGGRMAGTITAGLFIKQFVGDLPWVHIDIAGTSDIDKVSGYNVKGATGVGVRTLVQIAQNLSTNAC